MIMKSIKSMQPSHFSGMLAGPNSQQSIMHTVSRGQTAKKKNQSVFRLPTTTTNP